MASKATTQMITTIDIGVNYGSTKYTFEQVERIMDVSNKGYKEDSCTYQVEKCISISNSLKEVITNLKLVEKLKNLYCTVGVHPHNAKDIHNLKQLDILETYLSNPKVVAIGECGLDYDRMFSPKEKQIEVFRKQIQIAKKYGKPLYLHCRGKTDKEDSFTDMLQILNEEKYFTGVVHCFTGNGEQANEFIKLGLYLGITGWIYDEKRNKDLYDAIKKVIPIEKILIETDAPWLSIDKSRKSEPLDTAFIAEKIAIIKKISYDDTAKMIYKNTYDLFKF
jgi:TatD DNase family protein